MNVTIENLKTHIESYISTHLASAEAFVHDIVRRAAVFVEGKQAEADATSYLTARGYTVTPPSTPSDPLAAPTPA